MFKPYKILKPDLTSFIKEIYASEFQNILNVFATNRFTTFRVNNLKSSNKQIELFLKNNNIIYQKPSWFKDAFIIQNYSLGQLQKTDLYLNGSIYVQSLSSMIPPLILNPRFDSKVLDIAAAPGSKTTQMADIMCNSGEIVANDASKNRIFRLEANLVNQGVKNVKIENISGQQIWKKYPEYFDYALVDVPCTTEGRINLSNKKSYYDWSYAEVKRYSEIQKWILKSAISSVKPGGLIIYSTCSIMPEENEEVISWILKKEKNNIILKNLNLKEVNFSKAFLKWQNKIFDNSISKTKRITISENYEGFFIALIQKIKSNIN